MLERWPQDRVDELRRLYEQGLTYSEIAARLGDGLTRSAISGRVARLGLSQPRPPKPIVPPKPVQGPKAPPERKRRRRKVTAAMSPAPASAPPRHISLLDLNETNCHFPFGDNPFTFCGQPTDFGKPYCPSCDAIAHDPRARPHTRAERDIQRQLKSNERAFR